MFELQMKYPKMLKFLNNLAKHKMRKHESKIGINVEQIFTSPNQILIIFQTFFS